VVPFGGLLSDFACSAYRRVAVVDHSDRVVVAQLRALGRFDFLLRQRGRAFRRVPGQQGGRCQRLARRGIAPEPVGALGTEVDPAVAGVGVGDVGDTGVLAAAQAVVDFVLSAVGDCGAEVVGWCFGEQCGFGFE